MEIQTQKSTPDAVLTARVHPSHFAMSDSNFDSLSIVGDGSLYIGGGAGRRTLLRLGLHLDAQDQCRAEKCAVGGPKLPSIAIGARFRGCLKRDG